MKKFISDFKAFINRGNIIDMAIGVIIGGAFGKIVTSLVNDIIMPLITYVMGANSLAELSIVLKTTVNPETGLEEPSLLWAYGNFLQTIIDFLIIAICLFIILKIIMKSQKLINESKPNSEEKKILKSRGIKLYDIEAVNKELKVIREEKKKADELAKKQNYKPTELDVLNEIRDLLKEKN